MRFQTISLVILTAVAVAGCSSDQSVAPRSGPSFAVTGGDAKTYVLLGSGNVLPAGLAAAVQAAGGSLTASLDGIGVAIATSSRADFQAKASAIRGVEVARDTVVQWIDPNERVIEAAAVTASDEPYYRYQWAPRAISAPAAWAAGYDGTGARVAVLDGGLNNLHIDLNGSVDVAASHSFVPGFLFNQDVAGFSHATHVAGIVAARDNSVGTIGVAPGATIIGVKVLHNGSGSFSAIIQGIVYAARPISQGGAGANIINMSLGAGFYRQGVDAAQLASALSRATNYAYQQGVTVIASAGNNAIDIDHTANLIFVPAQSAHVIAVSATGPVGGTNFDRPASYTNFGQSAIGFAAPGGDVLGNFYDMVISPGSITGNDYYFAAGTSMAAPHVAGVAALIIGKNGGSMQPAQVEAVLRQSADDLGKPGNDDFYGRGRVNAGRAVQ